MVPKSLICPNRVADQRVRNHECPQFGAEGREEGVNDWKHLRHRGPGPPVGRHRYFHKLYALKTRLDGSHRLTKAEVEATMGGQVIAQAELIGASRKK
jgi:phosphatidylethanolamine-binding protein (PEBP) family uncharacterized protein